MREIKMKKSKVGGSDKASPHYTDLNNLVGMSSKNYNSEDLQRDVQYIRNSVTELNTLVRGDNISAEPNGLIQHVAKNTQFRRDALKVLWFLGFTVSGLVINQLFDLF